MAVCRKTRVIKLGTIAILLLLGLRLMFPDEVQTFLTQFAPPAHEAHKDSDSDNRDNSREEVDNGDEDELPPLPPGHVIIDKAKAQRRSEHEPYLTPGNPGNFEPLREEFQEGPGEGGAPHFLEDKSKKREAEEAMGQYGESRMFIFNFVLLQIAQFPS